jgi:ABC-2 type transport system ATP-binding protein
MAGLLGMEGRLARELPGGWRQRLALACSVLHQPRVLFLDEPTNGVDPISRRRFWDLIDETARQGVTVFVTTHYLDEAEHCHRIALIEAGRLGALGTVSQLKSLFGTDAVLEVSSPFTAAALELLEATDWVLETAVFGTKLHAVVAGGAEGPARVVAVLEKAGLGPATAVPIVPSLEDVFIHHLELADRARAAGVVKS